MKTITQVKEFHKAFGHPIEPVPFLDDVKTNQLRVKLLAEEVSELAYALKRNDQIHTLDALLDIQYVLDGAFLALGFASVKEAAFAEVHRSNMSKLGRDGKPIYRADGKIIKGPDYRPPDLKPFIF